MIRRATLGDVPVIHSLVNHWARKGSLMPRSVSDLCDELREFFVYELDGQIVGCGALHLTLTDATLRSGASLRSTSLAEIRSVAVAENYLRRGIGTAIVEACLADAGTLQVPRLFVLTIVPEFFERFGFCRVPRETFPHKISAECINCPRFPDCKEVAMALELKAARHPTPHQSRKEKRSRACSHRKGAPAR